jgi:hypothetical protein
MPWSLWKGVVGIGSVKCVVWTEVGLVVRGEYEGMVRVKGFESKVKICEVYLRCVLAFVFDGLVESDSEYGGVLMKGKALVGKNGAESGEVSRAQREKELMGDSPLTLCFSGSR